MTRGPWEGDWPISAGWRYSSGNPHYAWDIACPMSTPLYAIGNGTIVDCNDGVRDQPPGQPAGSGAPSNWIILRFTAPAGPYKGQQLHAYYQHLTKGGVKVRKGQKVSCGDLIGKSGNSGNTTGPHLHLVVLKPGHTMTEATRYAYLSNPDSVVWTPDRAWGNTEYGDDMPLSDKDLKKIAEAVWGFMISDPTGMDDGKPVKDDKDKAETMLRNIRRDTAKGK